MQTRVKNITETLDANNGSETCGFLWNDKKTQRKNYILAGLSKY
jgi:hypothetical protein